MRGFFVTRMSTNCNGWGRLKRIYEVFKICNEIVCFIRHSYLFVSIRTKKREQKSLSALLSKTGLAVLLYPDIRP